MPGFLRFNFYGGRGDSGGQLSPSDASEAINYGSEILVDIEARYDFNDNISLSVGVDNLFDVEPDDDGHFVAEILGVDKALTSPFGVNGGFWYARLVAEF
ncbi:MAG: TonB-dependent receptor [Proteobacteria bacterium]|nr:TonB-dependent receptor [Pseudomonadota bacterium]